MSVRLVDRPQPPEPPERELWRLQGPRLPLVCIVREYAHGLDVIVLHGENVARSQLVRTGPADAEGLAASWRAALVAKGWTEISSSP